MKKTDNKLAWSIVLCDLEGVKSALDAGESPNDELDVPGHLEKRYPLTLAIMQDTHVAEMVNLLLSYGADTDVHCWMNLDPLSMALVYEQPKAAFYLVKQGVSLGDIDDDLVHKATKRISGNAKQSLEQLRVMLEHSELSEEVDGLIKGSVVKKRRGSL